MPDYHGLMAAVGYGRRVVDLLSSGLLANCLLLASCLLVRCMPDSYLLDSCCLPGDYLLDNCLPGLKCSGCGNTSATGCTPA